MQPFSVTPSEKSRRGFIDRRPLKYCLNVNQLVVGMHVVELDRPWEESPFLFQGFTLENVHDISLVKNTCQYVYVDAVEESWLHVADSKKQEIRTRIRFISEGVKRDRNNFQNRVYLAARNHIEYIFKSMQIGRNFTERTADIMLSDFVYNLVRNPGIVNVLAKIRAGDEYTFQHSLNVAIYSVALGVAAGIEPFELKNLGVCALFHDIGKIRISDDILNKSGSLAAHELAEMRLHPEYGKKLLMSYSDQIYPGAVDVAYSHHERLDGKGYPRGIDGRKISKFTRIVSIADAYDAMTSQRCYQDYKSSMKALSVLRSSAGDHFDENLVDDFCKIIGICSPGCVVEMTNGEVGIVLSNRGKAMKPKVILLTDEFKIPIKENVVDLENDPVDRNGYPYEVMGDYRSGSFGIDVYEYIKKGLRVSGLLEE